jgi:hypothetical protein
LPWNRFFAEYRMPSLPMFADRGADQRELTPSPPEAIYELNFDPAVCVRLLHLQLPRRTETRGRRKPEIRRLTVTEVSPDRHMTIQREKNLESLR